MGFFLLYLYLTSRAFEQTALTIVQVGQQGVIASLLRAEANALRIEACNEALTELISLFNVCHPIPHRSKLKPFGLKLVCVVTDLLLYVLRRHGHHQLEEIVDVRRWQTDLEVARVRDHHELLSMGHRIESDNAAINRELAQQGDTIKQVLRGIHVRPPLLLLSSLSNAPTHTRVLLLTCAGIDRISMLVFRMRTSTARKRSRLQYR